MLISRLVYGISLRGDPPEQADASLDYASGGYKRGGAGEQPQGAA